MISYTEIANAPWIFVFVGVILIGVILQNIFMMRKAWKHAQELGLENDQIRKGVRNGILVSIVPTIPVMIVLLTLVPLLGAPLPWLRLSVIGSAPVESMAANEAITAVGETLAVGGYTVVGWIAACWCMSLGNSSSLVWSTLAIRPISKMYESAEKFDIKMVLVLGTGCLMGIMAYATYNYGLSSISNKGVIFGISFICGALMVWLSKKFPKQRWIGDFLMAICMIIGMIAACILL